MHYMKNECLKICRKLTTLATIMSKLSRKLKKKHTQMHTSVRPCFKTITIPEYATKMSKRILVTGGTGLVGKGLDDVIKEEISNGLNNEEWFFIGSKDGDLTYVLFELISSEESISTTSTISFLETWKQSGWFSKNISQLMWCIWLQWSVVYSTTWLTIWTFWWDVFLLQKITHCSRSVVVR